MRLYKWLTTDEGLVQPGPVLSPVASLVLVGTWISVVVALLLTFHFYQWDVSYQRFGLLAGLGTISLLFTLILSRVKLDLPGHRWIALAFLAVAIACGFLHAESSFESIRKHWDGSDLPSDQGQNCYRAVELLKVGVNPYGYDTFLDPDEWRINGPWMTKMSQCVPGWDYEAANQRMEEFWATLSLDLMKTIVPDIPLDSDECRYWSRRFHSLGAKYGPMLLLGYWPFVEAFGQVGILVSNLFVLVSAMTGFIWWMRRWTRHAVVILVPVLVVLAGGHIRGGMLSMGHSDLLPTALAGAFLILWIEKKHRWAAVVLGCCVAAKTFPGMIYVPLLLRRPKDLPYFILPLAAFYLPLLIWDARGLWYNFSYPLFYVRHDAGSVGHIFSATTQTVMKLACVGTAVSFLLMAFFSRWHTRTVLLYVVVAHVAAMCAGRMFHNNYLTWLAAPLSILIFWCVREANEAGKAPETALEPA